MKPVGIISIGVLLLLLGTVGPTHAQQDQNQEAKPPKQVQQSKPEKRQPDRNKQQQDQKKGRVQQPDRNKQQQPRAQQPDRSKQQQRRAQQPDQSRQQQQRAQQPDQSKQEQPRAQQPDQSKQQQPRAQQQDRSKQQQPRAQQQDNGSSRQRQRVQRDQQREVWQQHRARDWQSEHRDWRQRGGYTGYRIPDTHYRGSFGENHWFRIHRYPMELYGGYPRFQYGGFWFGFMDPWPEYWADDWYDNDDVYVVYSEDGYYLCNRRYPRDRIAITVYVD